MLAGEKKRCTRKYTLTSRPSEVSGHTDPMGLWALVSSPIKWGYHNHLPYIRVWEGSAVEIPKRGLQQTGATAKAPMPNCYHCSPRQAFLRVRCSYLDLKGPLNLLKCFQKLYKLAFSFNKLFIVCVYECMCVRYWFVFLCMYVPV